MVVPGTSLSSMEKKEKYGNQKGKNDLHLIIWIADNPSIVL